MSRRRVDSFVERMDVRYHRGGLPLIGWLFCDWWDIRVGADWWMVAKERARSAIDRLEA